MNIKTVINTLKDNKIYPYIESGKLKTRSESNSIDPEIVALIKSNKQALIDYLLDVEAGNFKTLGVKTVDIPLCDRSQSLALSYPQRSLWFIDQHEGSTKHYNISSALSLFGELNFSALQYALDAIIARHEVLRTNFVLENEVVVQQVRDPVALNIDYIDLSKDTYQDKKIEALAIEKAQIDFNLKTDLMLNVSVAKISERHFVAFFTMHHIASDAWSLSILNQELISLYQSFISGDDAALPPLELQYADFSQWQQQEFDSPTYQKKIDYWQENLSAAPRLHQLPLDYVRPEKQSHAGGVVQTILTSELSKKLNYLAREQDVTLFSLMQSAFALLLARWSNQDKIVMGTPVAGRDHDALEGLIGYFVNTLVLHNDVVDNCSFTEFLNGSKQGLMSAFENQDVPFEMLVEKLQVKRSLSYTPIFQIMFSLQHADSGALNFPGLTTEPLPTIVDHLGFDLELHITDTEEGIVLNWHYASSLFNADTINRMAMSYEVLITAIIAEPETNIYQLPLITGTDINTLDFWNDTTFRQKNGALSLHQVFENQVNRQPNAVALTVGDVCLSYSELNAKVNQLAHYFLVSGVDQKEYLAICLPRGEDIVVAILATLKVGCAYIPLDPEYPKARLAYILENSAATRVITLQTMATDLSIDSQLCFFLDDANTRKDIAGCSKENPKSRGSYTGEDAAYIIYTSGTTGKPKGVVVSHVAASSHVLAMYQQFTMTTADRYLHFSSFSFDVSVEQLFTPLLGGASVYMLEDNKSDTVKLSDFIKKHEITIADIPPAYLTLLLKDKDFITSTQLRLLVVGGESMPPALIANWYASQCAEELYNAYGPTEAVITATSHSYTRKQRADTNPYDSRQIIGKAIAGRLLYVLSDDGQRQPIGVPGELYIGGCCIASSYHNQPDLNKEKFIDNPYSKGRFYRTGDLVRFLGDGNIEFLGRVDEQIKIRGFRIEPKEIEQAIVSQNNIEEAIVLMSGDDDNRCLSAFLLMENNKDFDRTNNKEYTQSIKNKLVQFLPLYMLPNDFMFLSEWPLTKNGKIDRLALSSLTSDKLRKKTDKVFSQAETLVEKMLSDIWSKVIGIENISVEDNFFSIGGDSIKAIQIVSQARREGYIFSTQNMFEWQTIRSLSVHIGDLNETADKEIVVAQGKQVLMPIGHQFFNDSEGLNHFNQSTLFSLSENFRPEEVEQAINAVTSKHDVFRLRFNKGDTGWEGHYIEVNLLPENIVFKKIDLSSLNSDEFSSRLSEIAEDSQTELNICQGPLASVSYFQSEKGQPNRLLWIIHHLIVDGVSWRILTHDLTEALKSLQLKQDINLIPSTTTFQGWCEALNTYANSSEITDEATFWLEQAQMQVLPLPIDFGDTESKCESSSASIIQQWTENETAQLIKHANATYHTQINDLLLAALLLSVNDWTSGNSMLFDLEGHGREDLSDSTIDVSDTVGWFTSIYPVFLRSEPSDDLADLIKSVKEQLRQIPKKGIGYGLLRYLSCQKDLLEQPEYSPIVFNYLGQFDEPVGDANSSEDFLNIASEYRGREVSGNRHRSHQIGINGAVVNGCLQFSFDYSKESYKEETINSFAKNYSAHLCKIIAHCIEADSEFTRSDFMLAKITSPRLSELQQDYALNNLYACTAMQQGMLLESEMSGHTATYIPQLQLVFEDVNVNALRSAWGFLIQRHDIFRTVFVEGDPGVLLQLVQSTTALPWQELDWSAYDNEQQGQRRTKQLAAECKLIGLLFESNRGPLMRLLLIKESDTRHRLVWTHHHALLDGWSLPIVLGELNHFYQRIVAIPSNKLSKPAMDNIFHSLPKAPSYHHYIHWLSNFDKRAAENYWKQYLADCTASRIPIPERQIKSSKNALDKKSFYAQKTFSLVISEAVTEKLEAASRKSAVTLNVMVQACWSLLLCRYANTTETVFGVTRSGRPAELTDSGSMVGLFINTQPMRVSLPKNNTSVSTWLKELHKVQVQQDEFSYASLGDIQTWWDGGSEGEALFDTLIIYENYPMDSAVENDENTTSLPIVAFENHEENHYPMVLTVIPGQQLQCNLMYQNRLFESDIVERFACHLEAILVSVADDCDQSVSDISFIKPDELQQLLFDWNNTTREYDRDSSIQDCFSAQVTLNPKSIAVIQGEEDVTYEELNAQANQLAHALIEKGVSVGSKVGICLERSLSMVVGVLGILKAGGIYLPLDGDYPQERLQAISDDTALILTLTQSSLVDRFSTCDFSILCLDTQSFTEFDATNPIIDKSDNYLAYINYTSGSSGTPKGVEVTHRGVLRLVNNNYFIPLDETTRMLQMAPLTFDAATLEFWGPLLNGGQLILYPPVQANLDDFERVLNRHKVNTLWLTAGLFEAFSYLAPENSQSLRYLLVGGDVVSPHAVSRVYANHPEIEIINGYGPTENTTFSTTFSIARDWPVEQPIPIGKPIANTSAYVLDDMGRPQPMGAIGELYVGGDGVAQGYLNQPVLTDEQFIPNPYGGGKLYKTGDLVRWLSNGTLSFIGRRDNQVKIRGFRIELGEIESVLRLHADVREAIVVIKEIEAEQSRKQIIAYIVSESSNDVIMAYLEERIPDYMLPAFVICLDHLPLTVNGKVDRRALLLPNAQDVEHYQAPNTPDEEQLCDIWQEVLNIERVGINENFFTLGGDSILSIRVVSLAKKHDLMLSVKDIFKHKTVAALANYLTDNIHLITIETKDIPPFSLLTNAEIERLDDKYEDAYPLNQLQLGMVYHSQLQATTYHDIASFHVQLPWFPEKFEKALTLVIQRHPVLRSYFDLNHERFLQCVSKAVGLPLQYLDIQHLESSAQDSYIANWIENEKDNSFNWSSELPYRVVIHRRAEDCIEMTISFHHAILDGWSLGILTGELFQFYQSLISDKKIIDTQSEWMLRDNVALELQAMGDSETITYWQNILSTAPQKQIPQRHIDPVDNNSKSNFTRNDQKVEATEFMLLSEPLLALAKNLGVPIQSILIAVHLKTIGVFSGNSTALSSVVSNCRPETTGGDKAVGLFLNSLPICLSLEECSWKQLILTVADKLASNLSYRHYPMSAIQHDTKFDFSQIILNYTHFHVYKQIEKEADITILNASGFEETNFGLGVNFSREVSGDRILLDFEFDAKLYEYDTIQRLSDGYVRAFNQLLNNVDHCHTRDSLLSDKEQDILHLWSHLETATIETNNKNILSLFERQVKSTPNAKAVVAGDSTMSYRELNQKSNQLAHYLIGQDIKPNDLIGLFVEHGIELLVGVLGILKAGAGYLPLDPDYPKQRLLHMIKDAEIELIITQSKLSSELSIDGITVFCLDDYESKRLLGQMSNQDPLFMITENDLAYVIYTSGSTGKSKGVMISHGNLLHYYHAAQQHYSINSKDNVMQFSSYSFDVSVEEIFLTLASGACLTLRDEAVLNGDEQFWSFILNNKVSVAILPTAFWHTLLDGLDAEMAEDIRQQLRLCVIGTDVYSQEKLAIWHNLFKGDIKLFNSYGPTECTIGATIADLTYLSQNDGISSIYQNIGKPLPNTSCFVLDVNHRSVPIGVPGELYLGGESLALGYLNRPELTAERFLSVHMDRDRRLYKTGDIVMWSTDGNINFVGRADYQIKIRGFRVEPGEIETIIKSYDDVSEVLVVVREVQKEERLLAYLKLRNENNSGIEDILRTDLKRKLPEYMLPFAFVFIDQWPLNVNGKIDRDALPLPEIDKENIVAAESEIEKRIVEIWKNILGLDNVSITDDFFAIGGHSLSATRLMTQLRKEFSLSLDVKTLFEYPTIKSLSDFLQKQITLAEASPQSNAAQISESNIIPRLNNHDNKPIPLGYTQLLTWFLWNYSGETSNLSDPMLLEGDVDIDLLDQALEIIVNHHEAIRAEIFRSEPLQIIRDCKPEKILYRDYEAMNQKEKNACFTEVSKLINDPIDLKRPPLIRTMLVRFGSNKHVFIAVMPHTIIDGGGLVIFNRHMKNTYEALVNGDALPFKDSMIRISDYVRWERNKSQELCKENEFFWENALANAGYPCFQIKYLREEGEEKECSLTLNDAVFNQLNSIAHENKATLQMLIMSVVGLTIFKTTHQKSFCLTSILENRDYEEMMDLAAPVFGMSLTPIRISLNDSFEDLLKSIKLHILNSYKHKYVSPSYPMSIAARPRWQKTSTSYLFFQRVFSKFLNFAISKAELYSGLFNEFFLLNEYPPEFKLKNIFKKKQKKLIRYPNVTINVLQDTYKDNASNAMKSKTQNKNWKVIKGLTSYFDSANTSDLNQSTFESTKSKEHKTWSDGSISFEILRSKTGELKIHILSRCLNDLGMHELISNIEKIIGSILANPDCSIKDLLSDSVNENLRRDSISSVDEPIKNTEEECV
ncbi:MAG: amino acid adenylation domain-containing protein [Oleiphilaceae bacterium]|jgi:amino acid adenylation domain-containing protein/non-ribosomal peptide synthase protein (TIGR01720 family)